MTSTDYIDLLKHYSKNLTEYKSQYTIFNPTLKNDGILKSKIKRCILSENLETKECQTVENELKKLNDNIIKCNKCPLNLKRNNAAIGRGALKPLIMFIGKSPKTEEDNAGLAFQDKIKEVIDNILIKVLQIPVETAYFTNALKCIPNNIGVSEFHKCLNVCSEYLYSEIDILQPKIICPLGNEALHILFKDQIHEKNTITELHGKSLNYKSIITVPTLNPGAFISHPDPNNEKRRIVFEDMKKLRQIMIDLNFI